MTVLESRDIDVEDGGRVIVGKLVPYDEPSIVADRGPNGSIVMFIEVWDRDSIRLPDGPIAVLIGHDENRPVGRVGRGRLWHDDGGLMMEATLSGSASELEGIVARARDNVQSGLSIGFFGDKQADIWESPTTANGLPVVLRRGASIREASLVTWPALTGATVTRVTARTEAQRETDRVLADIDARRKAKQVEAQRHSELLAEVSARKATVIAPPAQPPTAPCAEPDDDPWFTSDGLPTYPTHPYPEDGTAGEQHVWWQRVHNWRGTIMQQMSREQR